MPCPPLKIPYPRWAFPGDGNPYHDEENWKALERWAATRKACTAAAATCSYPIYANVYGSVNPASGVNTYGGFTDFDVYPNTNPFSLVSCTISGQTFNALAFPQDGIYGIAGEVIFSASSTGARTANLHQVSASADPAASIWGGRTLNAATSPRATYITISNMLIDTRADSSSPYLVPYLTQNSGVTLSATYSFVIWQLDPSCYNSIYVPA